MVRILIPIRPSRLVASLDEISNKGKNPSVEQDADEDEGQSDAEGLQLLAYCLCFL